MPDARSYSLRSETPYPTLLATVTDTLTYPTRDDLLWLLINEFSSVTSIGFGSLLFKYWMIMSFKK